jgi:energy-coupling factor transporter ATP-binding protein EcfA2
MVARLKRLKVDRLRDVSPGTELHFNAGWNVLLGRNGSGKTTLLHVLSMILRDDLSSLRHEAFAIEYDLDVVGTGELAVSVRNLPDVSSWASDGTPRAATIVRGRESDGHSWEVVIRAGEPLRVVGSEKMIAPQDPLSGARWSASIFARQGSDGVPTSAFYAWCAVIRSPLSDGYRFDEGLAMAGAIVGASESPRPSVPSVSGADLLSSLTGPAVLGSRFVPEAIAQRMSSAFDTARTTVEFDLGGDPLLDRVVDLFGARRVAVNARLADSPEIPARGRWFGRFEFYAQLSSTRLVHHDHWSFGQRRLLTLFWYLACNPDVVIADELVNGLHWEWIEASVEAIGERQVFVAVQNPLLLEHVGFESPGDVRRAFVLCRSELRGDERETVWAQPDDRQAESFFRAWSSGIQPVHELLKTEGLW